MKILAAVAASLLALAVSAQSPLLVQPAGGFYGWNPPSPSHQTFFNMTVNTTITLQALTTPLYSALGTVGSLELWMTNTGFTTFVGNETIAANWHQAATGAIVSNGLVANATACMQTGGGGLVIQPGTYGCAVLYLNVATLFRAVTTIPQTFSNAEMTVTGGAIQYTQWTAPYTGLPAGYAGWNWYGSITYANGVFPHACAENSYYGKGCYDKYGSFYQEFTQPTAANTALTGKSLSLIPNGIGGYDVVPGLAAYAYVAPTGAAIQIPDSDNGEVQQPLTIPFGYPGGLALDLFIQSNGIVSVASNLSLPNGGITQPNIQPFLGAPATGWWTWHQFNPTEAGSGHIWFEENPGNALISVTWLGVESYPTTSLNPSTWQLVLDPITGIVTYNWVAIDGVGGSGTLDWDDTLVGYSPGGASPDPSNTDLAALMAGGPTLHLPGSEQFSLKLTALSKPLIGTTLGLATTNETGLNLGLNFLSVVQIPAPGIDLGILGGPGCPALVDINAGVGNVIENFTPSMTINFPLPNNPTLAGVGVFSQSIWLDATANALGIITSNGVSMVLGNF